MEALLFFEKPGCVTNSRQKRLLTAAGIAFEARSLLAEPWTQESLLRFLSGLPVTSWFNAAAPRIKSGEVRPDRLDAMLALTLMVDDPLLIRRPLLQCGEWRAVGFDWPQVAARFGIDAALAAALAQQSDGQLEGCSHAAERHNEVTHCPSSRQEVAG